MMDMPVKSHLCQMPRWSFVVLTLVCSLRATAQVLPESIEFRTPLMAVVFLSPDCPISQKYMKKLNDLQSSQKNEVTFLAIVPGKVSKTDINDFVSEYRSELTFRQDKELTLTMAVGATVTPEIFLFDSQRTLVYRGAIDNWFYELGKNRREVTEHFFKDAVKASLKNQRPVVTSTEAIGCLIQYPAETHQHH